MRSSSGKPGPLFAIAVFAVFLTGVSCDKDAPRQSPGPSVPSPAAVAGVSRADNTAANALPAGKLFAIEGKPYSEDEVIRYVVTYGMGPHGMKGETRTVEDFIDRELVILDFTKRGLDRKERHSRQLRLFRLTTLGVDYARHGLGDKIPVTADEVKGALPKKYRMGIFDLLTFESEAKAREALEAIKTERDFYHYAKAQPEKLKSTDTIYPGTGFFLEFDELALFKRNSGEVAGYMETGVGAAIVLVREVRDLTSEEIARKVDQAREDIRERKKPDLIRALEEKHRVSEDRALLRRLAAKEVAEGTGADHDKIVASVDDLKISYLNLKAWINRDYVGTIKDITPESLEKLLLKDLENAQKQVVLGLEAEKAGHAVKDENNRRAFEELKLRYLHQAAVMERLGGFNEVPEREAKRYYEERRDKEFHYPEAARTAHIFTASVKKAEDTVKTLQAGKETFEEVARRLSEDEVSREKGGLIGLVRDSGAIQPSVRAALFSGNRSPGKVTGVVKGGNGYHIFKVYEYIPPKTLTYKEARSRIMIQLRLSRFEEARKALIQEAKGRYVVVRNEDGIAKMNKRLEETQKKALPAGPH